LFIAQAHSFRQQARLAITLAWVAGYTNLLSILTCGHVISHVSGTTSDLGRWVVEGSWRAAASAAYLLLVFMSGAVLAAILTDIGRRRGWESVYVLPMIAEAIALSGFAAGVELHDLTVPEKGLALYVMTGLASAAMGLQNATITRISSGVVRTTHVTGVLTDLGLELGQFLIDMIQRPRGQGGAAQLVADLRVHAGVRRLALLLSILGSFALGAGLGTIAFDAIPRLAMFPPVLFLIWIIVQDMRTPIAEIAPAELVDAGSLGLPVAVGVYRLQWEARGAGDVRRLPDLMAWIDRLPPGLRVVIIELSGVTQLDPDSAQELRAAMRRLSGPERYLVLAGIDAARFRELSEAGGGPLNPAGACPDLEMAMARAMALLHSP